MSKQKEGKQKVKAKEKAEVKVKVVRKTMTAQELARKVVIEHYGTIVIQDRLDKSARPEDATVMVPSDSVREVEFEGKKSKVPIIYAISTKAENIDRIAKSLKGDYVLEGKVIDADPNRMAEYLSSFKTLIEAEDILTDVKKNLVEVLKDGKPASEDLKKTVKGLRDIAEGMDKVNEKGFKE